MEGICIHLLKPEGYGNFYFLAEENSKKVAELCQTAVSAKLMCSIVQQNVQVGMCAHRRLRSACESAQSDQSIQWALNV